jgi:energy-converting hydrogenase A subunit R
MRLIDLDCEGPITKNDNALELSEHFIPQGGHFFAVISRYDDFLAEVVKREGYRAGNTLKLILPFLKAYGATNQKMRDYSAGNLLLIPGADQTLEEIRSLMPCFIISTSYEQYINALCDRLDFPKDSVYCTRLDLDGYEIFQEDTEKLRKIAQEIIKMPMPEFSGIEEEKDMGREARNVIDRLDEIFGQVIPPMKCGKILEEINPIGGHQKAKAVMDSLSKVGSELSGVMYVGDSITDVQALELVRENGGIAISFNGNRYALKSAQVACISEHTFPLLILAQAFRGEGREGVLRLVRDWPHSLDRSSVQRLITLNYLPCVEIISEHNIDQLIEGSERMRKEVRGKKVGELG